MGRWRSWRRRSRNNRRRTRGRCSHSRRRTRCHRRRGMVHRIRGRCKPQREHHRLRCQRHIRPIGRDIRIPLMLSVLFRSSWRCWKRWAWLRLRLVLDSWIQRHRTVLGVNSLSGVLHLWLRSALRILKAAWSWDESGLWPVVGEPAIVVVGHVDGHDLITRRELIVARWLGHGKGQKPSF